MTCYTFSCPAPCRRVIRVRAGNEEEAAWKIIKAGALTCRREGVCEPCDIDHPPLPSLSNRQLKNLVRLIMTVEDLPGAATGDRCVHEARYSMNP